MHITEYKTVTTMKQNLSMSGLNRSLSCFILFGTLLLLSCGDDPEPANEEELITTLTVTLTPQGVGDAVVMTFKDLDGPGSGVPEYIYSGGGSAASLTATTTYDVIITLLNENTNPAENITEEIEQEADEHLFCFTVGGGADLVITYADEDGGGRPIGLSTTWAAGTAGTGTVTVVLRHQPGTKTGDCPGGGETDINVTFNISIVD